jgi:hypothetical protein
MDELNFKSWNLRNSVAFSGDLLNACAVVCLHPLQSKCLVLLVYIQRYDFLGLKLFFHYMKSVIEKDQILTCLLAHEVTWADLAG